MSRAYKASSHVPSDNGAAAANVERLRPEIDDDHELTPFPVDCLPGAAGDMARAIAHAERVPESLTGCCVLGILSAAIGAGLEVRSGAQRKTRGSLFILASAQSGTGNLDLTSTFTASGTGACAATGNAAPASRQVMANARGVRFKFGAF